MSKAMRKAVELIGGNIEVARCLDVHPSFISQMVTGHRLVPCKYVQSIEQATHGAVTRYDLRPDVFGVAPAADTKKKRSA